MGAALYVVAGESSGDAHAAGLLAELKRARPGLAVHGFGGPRLRAVVGEGVRDWLDRSSVMGVVEVLRHYRYFRARYDEMLAEIEAIRPRVLLLIDYPGFNFRLAAAVRRRLPDTAIVQYVCPQVWAWKKGRIPKMARLFDEVLCLLPFEPEIFDGTGLRATFVGHPLIDELADAATGTGRQADLVALLPGSRDAEIERIFPLMLEVATRLRGRHPELRFEVPAARPALGRRLRELAAATALGDALRIVDGGAHRLMQQARCGVVASGTATVEAAYFGLPYCLVYKLAWPTYQIAKRVVKIPHIGLINILAREPVIEEFVQAAAEPDAVAEALERWLTDPQAVARLQQRLAWAVGLLGGEGAHRQAAAAVARWLGAAPDSRPQAD
jgi:lipid-A-disaccharide synthase